MSRNLAKSARGTYKDFFKSDTEEQRVADYVDTSSPAQVPFLPLLLGIVGLLVLTVVFVAKNT